MKPDLVASYGGFILHITFFLSRSFFFFFFFFLSNTVLQGLDIDYRKTLASFLWNYSDFSFLLKQIFEKPLKVGGVNWEIGIGIYTRKVLVVCCC